jgi:hypothetical protein
VLAFAGEAAAHDPLGRAQPSVQTTIKGSGEKRVIALRLVDVDSRQPIPRATVSVTATGPSGTRFAGSVERLQPTFFRCRLTLREDGRWQVGVRIGGARVVPTAFSLDVDVTGASQTASRSPGATWIIVISVVAGLGLAAAAMLAIRRRTGRKRASLDG